MIDPLMNCYFCIKSKSNSRMKTVKLITLALISLIIVSCGNNKKPDKNEPQVKVPPATSKNSTAKKQPAINPNMNADGKPGYATKFERGKKRRESIKDTYDDMGNLVERRDKMFDKFGNIRKKNRYTYKYDDAGRRIEQWYYATTAADEPIMSNVNYIEYNDRGQKIQNIFISYDANGNEVNWAKNLYKYNKNGRVTEDLTVNKEGIPRAKTIYNYEKNMLVSENFVTYDEKGNPTSKKTLKYNEFGKVIETIDE